MTSSPLVEVVDLCKHYKIAHGFFRKNVGDLKALDKASFTIGEKEIVGIVGESGSGKTTLARTLIRLEEPTSGKVFFDNVDITHMRAHELLSYRKHFQIVFQNPASSLNPRKTIQETLFEVIVFHEMAEDVVGYSQTLMKRVGLQADHLERYPHELSIGQQQRVSLARALVTKPRLLVLDECVSALDISVQAQVLNLLLELYEELNMSYLFISHDISVVQHLSDKVLVMKNGQIVEQGPADEVLENPSHPYTKELLSSALPAFVR